MGQSWSFTDFISSIFRWIAGRSRRDVHLVFDDFRNVLSSNGEALDVIADMSQKMSGDYLFDDVYVRKSSEQALNKVAESIDAFKRLSGGRYDLKAPFASIERAIRRVAHEKGAGGMGALVLKYDEISWEKSSDVGGKGYNLARVSQSGEFGVPDGFVITVHAFQSFMRHNRLENILETDGSPEMRSAARRAIVEGSLPPDVSNALDASINSLKTSCPAPCSLAVRSSANEEDGEYSFAGQFDTILNVPAELEALSSAYKKVIASLYSERSIAYQRELGYPLDSIQMAVVCLKMVSASKSGVAYTAQASGIPDSIVINAVWGIGKLLVEGGADYDSYTITRKPFQIVQSQIATKTVTLTLSEGAGISENATPSELQNAPCLNEEEALSIARASIALEKMFRAPQDIEWAFDGKGVLHILQSRPLKVPAPSSSLDVESPSGTVRGRVIMEGTGVVVQPGITAGKVFVLSDVRDLESIPHGAILVSRNDSPQFIVAMHRIAAILTDRGSPTGHMAALCREFRLPAVVNSGRATNILSHGEEITLHADAEGGYKVYAGIDTELLQRGSEHRLEVERLYEYRLKRSIMRYVVPLHLVNPLIDDFRPEKCETLHDILRFIHEKSVQELILAASKAEKSAKPRDLALSVPISMKVIDIGGGIVDRDTSSTSVKLEDIVSEPLRATIEGMTKEGLWKLQPANMGVSDFMSSMMRTDDILHRGEEYLVNNIAVISEEYMNLSLRLGYHFNLIDCYASEHAPHNHIYFRFFGGATEIAKRIRRVHMIETILNKSGFISDVKGDLIVARVSAIEKNEALHILKVIGSLVAFTKQLDTELISDEAALSYERKFLDDIE